MPKESIEYLSANNPNKKEETALHTPSAILAEMKTLDAENAVILENLMATILKST